MPRFNGDTCWDQNKQVFDAIVKSNGWDDETAALQLLAHLEGHALNVALLVTGHKEWASLTITDIQGDWRITGVSLRELSDEMGKTRPYS